MKKASPQMTTDRTGAGRNFLRHRWMPVSVAVLLVIARPASGQIAFNQDVRPILSKKCFQCHGPDEAHRKGDLRLDRADGDEGAHRSVLAPGDLDGSELWHRITTDDEDEVMPPTDSHVKAITAAEQEILRQWILDGAEYQDFWAFVPPRDPGADGEGIDHFVHERAKLAGLSPNPPADKRTLIRRITFDLTGLPPTLEEIRAFLADDSEDAYRKVVDRLLSSPRYGEHMAKYWLDLVRFADTNGMHHDHYRDMSPYRDWVIRAFNENLSFDDFTRYQIAGDLFPEPTTDQLIASGFNRLHLIIDRGTALPEESFTKNVIDRVSAVGTAFMGLTLQCAVCHDHKFDPITQKDFFQIYAYFNNFDGDPETGRRGGTDFIQGLQAPYIRVPDAEQRLALTYLENERDRRKHDGSGDAKGIESAIERYLESLPAAMVMRDREEKRPAHILVRGNYDQPGERVQRDTPAFLPKIDQPPGDKTRLDFARWLVAPDNPLTARVTVNRFWQQLFGVGLVKTSEDLGAQGEPPSHPELLDHLAVRFVDSGWDVKDLMRAMVLSDTYQQSSVASRERYLADPQNRLLSRGSRFRLDSEMIRDQILATAGLLNEKMFGKSVKPPQPDGLWKTVAMPSSYPNSYRPDSGEDIYRRSVYTFWKRTLPPPQMSIFDAPSRESCIARRERTNTPLQALVLMNEPEYFAAAKALAWNLPDLPDRQRIARAYETITSQLPTSDAEATLLTALADFRRIYADTPDATAAFGEDAELAAWTMLVHSLFNLDKTKTRE